MEDLQLSPVEKLALFQTSRQERKSFVQDLINKLNEGELSPLEIHLQLKAMEDIINQLTSTDEKKNKNLPAAIRYRQLLLESAEQHGKSFEYHNSKFEIKETGTAYDFTRCCDIEWEQMDAQLNSLKERIKERETFLKAVPVQGLVVTNQETGEIYTIYPPSKKSTTTVTVSLK